MSVHLSEHPEINQCILLHHFSLWKQSFAPSNIGSARLGTHSKNCGNVEALLPSLIQLRIGFMGVRLIQI